MILYIIVFMDRYCVVCDQLNSCKHEKIPVLRKWHNKYIIEYLGFLFLVKPTGRTTLHNDTNEQVVLKHLIYKSFRGTSIQKREIIQDIDNVYKKLYDDEFKIDTYMINELYLAMLEPFAQPMIIKYTICNWYVLRCIVKFGEYSHRSIIILWYSDMMERNGVLVDSIKMFHGMTEDLYKYSDLIKQQCIAQDDDN